MTAFTLKRKALLIDGGIYGTLSTDNGFSCVTLERTWDGIPKIPAGTYACQLGKFTLKSGRYGDYYQVMNVPNCTDILIHPANYVKDLEGCIGIGGSIGPGMICNSVAVFNELMELMHGQDFTLIVEDT